MQIDTEKCSGCGGCVNLCPQDAIYFADNRAAIDQRACTDCGLCMFICGVSAPAVECLHPQVVAFTTPAPAAAGSKADGQGRGA